MKKVISFVLILVIIFSLVGCGNISNEIKKNINSTPTQTPTPMPTAIPTPIPTPTPDPRIAMREEYSQEIDEAVANSGVKLVATGEVMTDEDKTINGSNIYVAKYYTYNEYKKMAICRSDTLALVIFVFDANIKTILPLVRDLAPIIDTTMIGVKGSSLDCKFEDLDVDWDNKISTQYWSYHNSLALIESQLGVDGDECQLTMYLNSNE